MLTLADYMEMRQKKVLPRNIAGRLTENSRR